MSKDAAVIKVLTQLKLRPEETLSQDEEDMLKRALDPEEQFLHDVERLFSDPPPKTLDK